MTPSERLAQCRRVSAGEFKGDEAMSVDEALCRAFIGFVLAILAACGFGFLAVGWAVWL